MHARVATGDDVEALGTALARAFWDDPVFEFMAHGVDRETRARRLRPFFRADVRRHLRLGSVWTNDDRTGAACWAPPGQWKVSKLEGMRLFLWPALFAARLRAFTALSSLSVIEREHPPEPPHWYLSALGTDPDHQGTGVGSALLAPVLERCDAEGLPAYLESSKQSNIPFYERHGFEVTSELKLPRGGPTVYPMWRGPR